MRLFTIGLLLTFCHFLVAQTNHAVEVTSNVFTPANLTIQQGDTVTWTNVQGFHNVSALLSDYPDNPEEFRNGNAAGPGWVYSRAFDVPGVYDYRCEPHVNLGMTGIITVEATNAAEENIVITEIMYNPPESGGDSLEYIEFFNLGPDAVDMTDWTISDGIEFTFPDFTLEANAFVVVATNTQAMNSVFGTIPGDLFQWESGGLSNGGEGVAISNAMGVVVDAVDYSDDPPWPTDAVDGGGASLVLCNVAADNNEGVNWQAANTGTGVIINENEVFGNPGEAAECGVVPPAIYFLTENLTLQEDAGTVTIQILAQNFTTGVGPEFTVSLDGQSTATDIADFNTNPLLPIAFMSGETALDTFEFTLTVIDDDLEESAENIVLSINANVETPDSLIFITIQDNDSEVVVSTIDAINDLDADGVALNVGQTVALQGVVHCIDFRGGSGLQFWIMEPNGDGINVFNFDDVSDYEVTEGDELIIEGELDQFRGLLEIVPTRITVVSQGNDLVVPQMISVVTEEVESRYVTLSGNLRGIDENPIFCVGGGCNVTVITNESDTLELRVEDETGVDSTFLANWLDGAANGIEVTGIVSQRDFEAPFDGFYQLFPCSQSSFGTTINVREPVWAADLRIFPNPTSGQLNINASVELEEYRLLDMQGRVLQSSKVLNTQQTLNLNDLTNGVYYLQLISGSEVVTRPVVKQ